MSSIREELEKLARQIDDMKLMSDGHVYQVWGDGEITIQKGGTLLWMRNLHTIFDGLPITKPLIFPHKWREHTFAFVTEADARLMHFKIIESLKLLNEDN